MQNEKNFGWLLIALLVFMIGVPVLDQFNFMPPEIMAALLTSWVLAVGVWSLKGFAGYFKVGIALAATGVVLQILSIKVEAIPVILGASAATIGFLLLAVRCTFVKVAFGKAVNVNRLVGAVSLYLLLAILWAEAYSLTETLSPGSISGLPNEGAGGYLSDIIYFSFVTMTTLGYGDIVPVSPIARALAYIQAAFGQFYIAILVAGLVSVYISHRNESRPN